MLLIKTFVLFVTFIVAVAAYIVPINRPNCNPLTEETKNSLNCPIIQKKVAVNIL